MGYKRLTQNHPTTKKMIELDAFAAKLGIRLEFFGSRTFVYDTELEQRFDLEDNDSGEVINSFPYGIEFRLVIRP